MVLELLTAKITEPEQEDYQSLSWIAGRLTHKLRNHLSVILTAASQIEFSDGSSIGDEEQYYLKTVLQATNNLDQVLHRFLLFANCTPHAENNIDFNELCRNELIHVAGVFASQPSSCQTKITEADKLPTFRGDVELLRVMLSNILENAFESAIQREDGLVAIAVESRKKNITIRVTDNGEGISDSIIGIIGNPFVTDKAGRAGLGLAIAKKVALKHNGSFDIQSTARQGTVVTLSFDCRNSGKGNTCRQF